MATKSPWFFCGACGFKNHPRVNGTDALKASNTATQDDTHVCEQCGEGNSHAAASEYTPNG